MDSLKTLMDKREYDLVLKLTEGSTDINSLFYRISAFLASGKGNDALSCIESNREILEKDLSLLIKVHIEILCLLGKFDQARTELDHYENLPYVSQEVEEILRDMPKYILAEEKKSFGGKNYTDDQIRAELKSGRTDEALAALDMIRDRNIQNFLPDLSVLLTQYPKQSIRSFALLLLVQQNINREFAYLSPKGLIKVNPSLLEPPFVGDEFTGIARRLSGEFNDPTLTENAVQLLSTYLLYIYPERVAFDDVLVSALDRVARKYLGRPLPDKAPDKAVEQLASSIEEAIEKF